VLIAALLELKSRLMLPGQEPEAIELDAAEAGEELLARLLDAQRYGAAASHFRDRLAAESSHRFRSAPLPPALRRASLVDARAVYEPATLAAAIGELLRAPEPIDTRHIPGERVSLAERLAHLRTLLVSSGSFTFDEAVARGDRATVAVTLFALLELYRQGKLKWTQREPLGEIRIDAIGGERRRSG